MFGHMTSAKKNTTLLDSYSKTLSKSLMQQRANLAERVSREEAERANQLKTDFIATMSHELRTPLNAVMGFSELIANMQDRGLSNDQVMEYAGHIHGAAEHLLSVINDILDISKIQSGRVVLDPSSVCLSELLTNTTALLKHKAQSSDVHIDLRIDDNVSEISADKSKIRQILINLIDNAIKYTRASGTVSVVCNQNNDEFVNIYVVDTGIGMSENDLKLALMPFGQVDTSYTRQVEGTGLGLPIADALIKLHGGTMEIVSARNTGTQIHIKLPIDINNPQAMD